MTLNTQSVPLLPRSMLFGYPTKTNPLVNPTGTTLSWLAPVNGLLNIWTAPIDAPEQGRPVTNQARCSIVHYAWTYIDGHLVYLIDADGQENFQIFVVDSLTSVSKNLTPFEGTRAGIHSISRKVRGHLLVMLNRRDPRFFDLYTLDIVTGALQLVIENHGFQSFTVDDQYRPQFATRINSDGTLEILRRDPAGAWIGWQYFPYEDASVSRPFLLHADGDALYLLDSRGRDTAALVRLDLNTGVSTVLAQNTRADITDVIVDPMTYEPIGYSACIERRVHVSLDYRMQGDLDFLAGYDIGDWLVVSRSENDRFWILVGTQGVSPACAYLYDRQSRVLSTLWSLQPELAKAMLAPMQPVTLRARDGLDLVCYLTRPINITGPGALVILVHGGPWERDLFGFNVLHQWLANRGYSVLSINFRGSTGFGKAFINAGDGEWGRRMDDDLLDGVDWAIREGIADPKRIGIMGGSYGGYAVLAGMTRNPGVYACGIDVMGPTNLETLIATIPVYWETLRTRFNQAIGDSATEAGLALLRERSPVYQAHRLCNPLLIGHGAMDARVLRDESDQMSTVMKKNRVPFTYVVFPDEGHGFAHPENAMYFNGLAEAFLAQYLGGRAEPISTDERRNSHAQIIENIDLGAH